MKNTDLTTVSGAYLDDARPDTPPPPPTQRIQRSRGRPPKDAPTDGQMTLTGEVVAYVEPPSRSPWAEPNPELDDLQADDLEAVAEAAAEVVTADLDAELAEISRDADGHMFSVPVNRQNMSNISPHLTPTERLMFVAHGLAMGPAPAHHWPLENVGALVGVTRESATRATTKLVKLGVLHRKDRGRIDAMRSRPAEYRFADAILESTTRVTDEHTGDEIQTECPTCVTNDHTGTGVTDEHTVESSKDLSLASGSNSQPRDQRPRWQAEGARCDTCGGPVNTNPNTGEPNPQCKSCYSGAKTAKATASDGLYVMKALISKSWGHAHGSYKPDDDELLSLFANDQQAVNAAKSLRFRFGVMTDRQAAQEWQAAYDEAGWFS